MKLIIFLKLSFPEKDQSLYKEKGHSMGTRLDYNDAQGAFVVHAIVNHIWSVLLRVDRCLLSNNVHNNVLMLLRPENDQSLYMYTEKGHSMGTFRLH